MKRLLLPLLVLILTPSGFCQTAQDYNIRGMAHYEAGDYIAAEMMFRSALEMDMEHIKANYNLACMLALQYDNRTRDYIPHEAYHYLYISTLLEPERMLKARTDRDLQSLYNHESFRVITGQDDYKETFILRPTGADFFEASLGIHFEDAQGNIYIFSNEDPNFHLFNHFYVQESQEMGMPMVYLNSQVESSWYRIETHKVMVYGDLASIYLLDRHILSVEPVE